MTDQHELIADLEAEIENLHEAAHRCQKIDLAARVTVAFGLPCLAAAMVWFKPIALVIGIALVLGGLALHGSNRSTRDEVVARIRATEARRAEIIDDLGLREVTAP